MYRDDSLTPRFPEFGLPFGGCLDPHNRWIKKTAMIPWKVVGSEYQKHLSGSTNGSPAITARLAFGALVIKEELNLSDRETVEQIRENPYLQFFVGLEGFQTEEPFDASMMVYFRKRFPIESMNRINEAMVLAVMKSEAEKSSDKEDLSPKDCMNQSEGLPVEGNELSAKQNSSLKDSIDQSEESPVEANESSDQENPSPKDSMNQSEESPLFDENRAEATEPENQGKLIVDATCTPADIRFPTDLSLLNEAREKTEEIIDQLHRERPKGSKKPRTYRKKARKEYRAVAKKKSKSAKMIRKALRKQLNYVRRNLAHIQMLSQTVSLRVLKRSLYRALLVISELYRQQQIMYDLNQKRIDDRIVSIWFPYVRPIKRGKANADTEFGAKLHISLVNGFTFVERIDWNNFNEGTDLIDTIETYHRRFGFYPESVHADKIYRTRKNMDYCKEHGIRLSGPPLGRPPKDETVRQEQKKLARQDEKDRIAIEGKFGQGKRRFGLARIMAKLAETSLTVIGMNLLVMNLEKISRLWSVNQLFLFMDICFERLNEVCKTITRASWKCSSYFLRHRNSFGLIFERCMI